MSELCQILYSEEYSSLMKELNRSLEEKVYSEEALELTEQVLNTLASHYTTWHYRFQIITQLKKDLFEELDWCETIALENEKNYQIWNYRQLIIEQILADAELAEKFSYKREFPVLNVMLEQDAKNHHVWSYRKWLVERFGIHNSEQELAFSTKLIDYDVRNNSAWTHRFFLRFKGLRADPETVASEIEFAKQKIAVSPQNASSWNYLRGIYAETNRSLLDLKDFCVEYADLEKELVLSSFALELLAKIAQSEKDTAQARKIFDALALTYDPMRANYWNYLKKKMMSPEKEITEADKGGNV